MPKDIYTEDEWDVIPESIDQDRVKQIGRAHV